MEEKKYAYKYPHPSVTADCIIFGFDGGKLKVLLIERGQDPYKGRWVFPGGFVQMDESCEDGALRELEEETPYRAQSVRLLHTFYTAPGFCDEKMYLYLAEGITPTSTRKPDQDEFVETVLLSRQAVREAIANNQIQDGKTLVGLQYWLLNSK